MGNKQIQDGKEMNTGAGKESHTDWEGNSYRVGRKHIHGGKEMHTRSNPLTSQGEEITKFKYPYLNEGPCSRRSQRVNKNYSRIH